jgi:hypothetical protein
MPRARVEENRSIGVESERLYLTTHQRLALLGAAAGIAFIAGYLGGTSASATWQQTTGNLVSMVLAFVIAIALLRFVDAVTLHLQVSGRGARSRRLAEETRQLLKQHFPGVDERAQQIDAQELVDRALNVQVDSRQGTNARPEST